MIEYQLWTNGIKTVALKYVDDTTGWVMEVYADTYFPMSIKVLEDCGFWQIE